MIPKRVSKYVAVIAILGFAMLLFEGYKPRPPGWWSIPVNCSLAVNSRPLQRPLNKLERELDQVPSTAMHPELASSLYLAVLITLTTMAYYWDTYVMPVKWLLRGHG